MFEKVLTRNFGLARSEGIDVYIANGGYQALPKVLHDYKPEPATRSVHIVPSFTSAVSSSSA